MSQKRIISSFIKRIQSITIVIKWDREEIDLSKNFGKEVPNNQESDIV